MSYPLTKFPFTLDKNTNIDEIKQKIEKLSEVSPYGWGHEFDLGSLKIEGQLGNNYLKIVENLDSLKWFPKSMNGLTVADVGCYSGGISMIMASREAEKIFSIDEIKERLEQCKFMSELFKIKTINCIHSSLYQLLDHIEPNSLDLVVCSGVLYHLSDMLVGLLILQKLLKPGGILILESNAVDSFDYSYANFGRFYAGMWWQPSALCIKDMVEHMGFNSPDIKFYTAGRCLARAIKPDKPAVPFKRGMNWKFETLIDEKIVPMKYDVMRPAPL